MTSSSSEFELSQKDDDWMDVTGREELLQRELTKLKAALAQRSQALDESMKNRHEERAAASERLDAVTQLVADLTHQIKSLQQKHRDQTDAMVQRETELQQSHAQNQQSLQTELASWKTRFDELTAQKDALQTELARTKADAKERAQHNLQVVGQNQTDLQTSRVQVAALVRQVQTLGDQNASLERLTQQQQTALEAAQKQQKASAAAEAAVRQELAAAQRLVNQRSKVVTETSGHVSKLAVYAEDLKAEKVALQRTVLQQEQTLTAQRTQQRRLEEQLAAAHAAVDDRVRAAVADQACTAAAATAATAAQQEELLAETREELERWRDAARECQEQLVDLEEQRKVEAQRLHQFSSQFLSDMDETFTEFLTRGLLNIKTELCRL